VILLLVAAGCAAGAGLWLIASAIWPPPRPLEAAVGQLRAVRPRPARAATDFAVDDGSPAVTVGRWVLRRWRVATLVDGRTAADLAMLGRPVEVYAGVCALSAVAGAVAGPLAWLAMSLVGTTLPVVVPLWLLAAGAVAGWFVPRLVLRGEAARARADFRHALGAYLDVLVLLLAAHEGPESAMDIAAGAGQGAAFDELRRAVFEARLSGEPVWNTLDALGDRLRIVELREIAAAGMLAGESGAAVRRSLTAKARSLRQAALAEAEATARRQSQALFAPLVLMGLGFVLFLIYPMVTNLTVGGG
jgi:hypothetical protein